MGSAMNAFFNVMVPDKTSPLSWISANADNIEAVSYTHLDVYKRQI